MVLSKEEKIKLLEKARAVRAANLAKKREASGGVPATPPVVEPEPEPEPEPQPPPPPQQPQQRGVQNQGQNQVQQGRWAFSGP